MIFVQNAGDAEVNDLHFTGLTVPDDVRTADIFVSNGLLVNVAQSPTDRDGDFQSFYNRRRILFQPRTEALGTNVLDTQGNRLFLIDQPQDLGHIGRVNSSGDLILLVEADDFRRGRRVGFEDFQEHRRPTVDRSGFEDQRVRTFVDLLGDFESVNLQKFRHA